MKSRPDTRKWPIKNLAHCASSHSNSVKNNVQSHGMIRNGASGLPALRSLFCIGLLCVVFFAEVAHATLFSWKDEKGQLHVTDNAMNIPPQFRQQDGRVKTFESKPAPVFTEKAKPAQKKEFQIPLMAGSENHFFVEVVINGSGKARLLLDTGASMITLSQNAADRLGLNYLDAPKISFSTAGGMVEMPLIALDSVSVEGASASLVETAVNAMDMGQNIDGLLGMSFLSNFKFEIDQIHARLVLRPLSNEGEMEYGERPGDWWKHRFDYFKQRIRQSSSKANSARAGRSLASRNAKKLETHYKTLYRKLGQSAFRAGVPEEFK